MIISHAFLVRVKPTAEAIYLSINYNNLHVVKTESYSSDAICKW